MQSEEAVGLVCAGTIGQSFLARLPALLRRLGPIKTPTFRTSRLAANQLRAGEAVSHYSALEACRLILVWVPEEARLDKILRDLVARTPIRQSACSTHMVALCECVRDSRDYTAFRATGARVATVNPIPDSNERIFVAEGHPATVRRLHGLFTENQRKLIRLKSGTKPLFFAGVHAGAPLLLPWIAAGMASLRAAGFSRSEAATVGELLGVRTLRKYAKAGGRAWNQTTAAELRRALNSGVPEIRASNPELADLYEQGIRLALTQF